MEKEGQEIAASDGGKGPAEQHAIDVGHVVQHGDGKCEDGIEKERVAVVEDVQTKNKSSRRVAALDAFRGLTIVLMILVDDAGGAYERMDHSPWNGCTLADFVMPFFLFIVGVAIAFALKVSLFFFSVAMVLSVLLFTDHLAEMTFVTTVFDGIYLGMYGEGGYSHAPDDLAYGVDMKKIRWCGILQRIALVYFFVALIEALTVKDRLGGLVAFVVYMVTTFSLYVPDWSFVYHNEGDVNDGKQFTVKCGVRASLEQACNAVGYVDRQVWGINHLYTQPVWIRSKDCTSSSPNMGPLRSDAPAWCLAPFEPEGLLSSISSVLSGTIGIHYGHVLIHFKTHKERLKHWLLTGFSLLVLGIILHFTNAIPINKQLYSFSYVCFTGGAAGIVLSAFYILIDVWGLRTPFLFLEWIGMNAMLVFVLGAQGILAAFVNGWYYGSPDNTLVNWIVKHVFVNVWHSQRLGTLLYVMFCEIVFWGVAAGVLHKLGIYWKL
ncbi:Heparan-alpha-glucosaminide N-acetyltransferase [Zea mays]|uniref:Heparan-alpha-glucosaminide N-acetyltransferase n=1 Tax=Zea mays TaxID=4577 RepID=A0A3L6F535_MAIZE|nr:Heparan-alpha-glucosaminide N-acetyltransferase [Zea mays]